MEHKFISTQARKTNDRLVSRPSYTSTALKQFRKWLNPRSLISFVVCRWAFCRHRVKTLKLHLISRSKFVVRRSFSANESGGEREGEMAKRILKLFGTFAVDLGQNLEGVEGGLMGPDLMMIEGMEGHSGSKVSEKFFFWSQNKSPATRWGQKRFGSHEKHLETKNLELLHWGFWRSS